MSVGACTIDVLIKCKKQIQFVNCSFIYIYVYDSSAKTLQISFVGMQTQEVTIKPNVKVVMKSDSEMLDEVMVVAYGTAKKSSFTGAASSVSGDKIGRAHV